MFSATPKCISVDAPEMTVPPMPLLLVGDDLRIAYHASYVSGEEERWVIVRFLRYLHFRYGYPNDEVLNAHPLYKYGLGFYGVFEVTQSPLIKEIEKMNAIHRRHIKGSILSFRHWVFTFQDQTLEVISRESPTFEVVSAASAADAIKEHKFP